MMAKTTTASRSLTCPGCGRGVPVGREADVLIPAHESSAGVRCPWSDRGHRAPARSRRPGERRARRRRARGAR